MRMLVALVLGATSCEVLGYNETMNYNKKAEILKLSYGGYYNVPLRLNSTFDFSDPLSFDSLRVWAILFVSGVTRDYIRRKNFPGHLKSRPVDA